MTLPEALALSLAMTLAAECLFGLIWGVKRTDFRIVLLANVLTNPVVVACVWMAASYGPGVLAAVWAVLEIAAFAAEGMIYGKKTEIRLPWLFSLCANTFSLVIGLML